MIAKLLTEHHLEYLILKGGCRGSSESIHVKMPHCWNTHALAHFFISFLPDCGALEAPCNGQVVMTTSTVNSTATYTCEVGFALDVDVTRTCQSNGEWSGSAPCCEIGKFFCFDSESPSHLFSVMSRG